MSEQTYRFFTPEELGCSHCQELGITDSHENMDKDFMNWLVELRSRVGFGFIVNSAYRCKDHPEEASKESPGAHTAGQAMDISVSGKRAWQLSKEALAMNFLGLGVYSNFIHIDMWTTGPRPRVW